MSERASEPFFTEILIHFIQIPNNFFFSSQLTYSITAQTNPADDLANKLKAVEEQRKALSNNNSFANPNGTPSSLVSSPSLGRVIPVSSGSLALRSYSHISSPHNSNSSTRIRPRGSTPQSTRTPSSSEIGAGELGASSNFSTSSNNR